MTEFTLAEQPVSAELTDEVFKTAHERIVRVMKDIYSHNQISFKALEEAQMQVFACERVEEWLRTYGALEYWKAVSSAVGDVLARYPLQGYPLKNIPTGGN